MSSQINSGPISKVLEEIVYRTSSTNEKKCEDAIKFIYEFNRSPAPKILWFDDHYSAQKYLETKKKEIKVGDSFWNTAYNQLYILSSYKKSADIKKDYDKIKSIIANPPTIGYPGFGKFSILNWARFYSVFLNEPTKPETLTKIIDLFDATGYYLLYGLVLAVRNPENIYISKIGLSGMQDMFSLSCNYYIQYRNGEEYSRFLNYNTTYKEFEKLDSHKFEQYNTSPKTFSVDGFVCSKCNFEIDIRRKPNNIYSCDEMVIKDILE